MIKTNETLLHPTQYLLEHSLLHYTLVITANDEKKLQLACAAPQIPEVCIALTTHLAEPLKLHELESEYPWGSAREDYYALFAGLPEPTDFVRIRVRSHITDSIKIFAHVHNMIKSFQELGATVLYDHILGEWSRLDDFPSNPESPINQLQHLAFRCHEEDCGLYYWLHTYGMKKFGLPDLGIHMVASGKVSTTKELLKEATFLLLQKKTIKPGMILHIQGQTWTIEQPKQQEPHRNNLCFILTHQS